MAEILDAFPNGNGHKSRKGKYKFLFDGRIYRLTRGVDFPETMSINALRAGLGYTCARYGFSQHVMKESEDVVIVQLTRKVVTTADVDPEA